MKYLVRNLDWKVIRNSGWSDEQIGLNASLRCRMTTPWTLLWLIAPMRLGIGAGCGAVALVLLFLVWRLRQVSKTRLQLETQVAGLTRDLQKANLTLNEALAAIENENFTDPLTDLRNRRYLSAVIKADVSKVQRVYRDGGPEWLPNQDLVFFMVDLDHFSRINEFYGSTFGDKVLVAVAQALRRIVRESDIVIRWGGEEFLVVARATSRKEAPELAERIRTSVAGLSVDIPTGEVLRWTCCVGFAAYPFQPSDFTWLGWDRVVEVADACLGVAKKSGRNAWVGVQGREGLDRVKHGPKFPKELGALVDERVLEVLSSREDPFAKTKKVGEILG
jgi:diguanylate cyclase (GGDEF)-like protein